MAIKKGLKGVDVVLKNLNRQIMGIENRSRSGLAAAALVVQADAIKETPVDTGNLRHSSFTETVELDSGPAAIIGYTAAYAPYVHEIDKNYNVGSWKFLENSLIKNEARVLQIIERSAKIK